MIIMFMTRPIWTLMSKLPMFKNCQTDGLKTSLWLEDRVVNIPSSVPNGALKNWIGNYYYECFKTDWSDGAII